MLDASTNPPVAVVVGFPGRVIARAMGLWLLVYLGVVHLLVGWTWTSSPPARVTTPLVSSLSSSTSPTKKRIKAKKNTTKLPVQQNNIQIVERIEYQNISQELSPEELAQLAQLQVDLEQLKDLLHDITMMKGAPHRVTLERQRLQEERDAVLRWRLPDSILDGTLLGQDRDAASQLFVQPDDDHNEERKQLLIQQQQQQQRETREQNAMQLFRTLVGLETVLFALGNVSSSQPDFDAALGDLDRILNELEQQQSPPAQTENDNDSDWLHRHSLFSLAFWKLLNRWFDEIMTPSLQTIDWRQSFPPIPCAPKQMGLDSTTEEDNHDDNRQYLTVETVQDRFTQIQQLLHHRSYDHDNDDQEDAASDWPVSLDTTVAALETAYEHIVQQALQDLQRTVPDLAQTAHTQLQAAFAPLEALAATATTTTTSGSSLSFAKSPCLADASMVLPWLEAGLDAMYRKQDVRQAILQAIQAQLRDDDDDDDNVYNSIILDAVLPSDDEPPAHLLPSNQDSIPLRQLLDQPLTHQVAHWIDKLVDRISGYNDRLDQLLDTYFASYDNIGSQFVVQQLLHQASHLSVPSRKKWKQLLKNN